MIRCVIFYFLVMVFPQGFHRLIWIYVPTHSTVSILQEGGCNGFGSVTHCLNYLSSGAQLLPSQNYAQFCLRIAIRIALGIFGVFTICCTTFVIDLFTYILLYEAHKYSSGSNNKFFIYSITTTLHNNNIYFIDLGLLAMIW